VVGSVSRTSAVALCALVLVALAASGFADSARTALCTGAAAAAALVLAEWWRWHCTRRLGAVTGDVLGSLEELAFTSFLFVLALTV
jgi:cobalamin synthase